MDACIGRARAAGKAVLTLNTTDRMKEARALYAAMGFTRGPDHVFDDGFVLRSFSLPLDPHDAGAGDRGSRAVRDSRAR